MFQGETAITVDDKGRMAVPTAYRDLVTRVSGNRLVLTYNPFEAGCLWLYAEKEWERVRDDVMSKPNTQRVVRTLQQKLVGSSAVLEPGRQWPSEHPGQPPQCGRHREEGRAAGHGRQIRTLERAGTSRTDPADIV